jgi:tetratricopeptide (TPR) repeat protein
LQLSARVLKGLLLSGSLPKTLEPRVYDSLNRTLLAMLENAHFAAMPQSQKLPVLEEARGLVLEMGERFPNSRVTSEAMLRLAGVYIDALRRPKEAATLYDSLYRSPSASREQVQLARIGLGRAYVAAGDTAQARTLFTQMAHDGEFREGQGRAHYQLGLLDFMGGSYRTAQERLSSVAIDAPSADYTNDALDLALILAEQILGKADEAGLSHYGNALYHRATFDDAAMLRELEAVAANASGALAERSLLDLARHHRERGQIDMALASLGRLSSTAARYAAPGLELRADLLNDMGKPDEARALYERILVEYEGYVMMDAVREKIRALPAARPGDLP